MKGAEEFIEEFKELVKKQSILIPGTEQYVFNWLENAFFMIENAALYCRTTVVIAVQKCWRKKNETLD